jgi:hypothetical protein
MPMQVRYGITPQDDMHSQLGTFPQDIRQLSRGRLGFPSPQGVSYVILQPQVPNAMQSHKKQVTVFQGSLILLQGPI